MQFVVYCKDKPDHMHVRTETRPAHVDFLKSHADSIICAGPMLAEEGDGMIGSTLIVEFDDRAAVEAWAAQDPYAQAGLFASVEITPMKVTFPPK